MCSPGDYKRLKPFRNHAVPLALIKQNLTGIGRAFIFTTDGNGGFKPLKLIEGEIVQGQFVGYSRQITSKGSCQVGFWKAF